MQPRINDLLHGRISLLILLILLILLALFSLLSLQDSMDITLAKRTFSLYLDQL